jgi:hypothetical protein
VEGWGLSADSLSPGLAPKERRDIGSLSRREAAVAAAQRLRAGKKLVLVWLERQASLDTAERRMWLSVLKTAVRDIGSTSKDPSYHLPNGWWTSEMCEFICEAVNVKPCRLRRRLIEFVGEM